jgi:tetratricopeptide (TPR) repeat protein
LPSAGFAHGDLHEQIEVVTRELLAAPLDGALYFRRAELRRAHEEWVEAVNDYDEAESLAVDPHAVRLGRAKALQGWRRPAQARTELDWLIERAPNHVEALVTRARVRVALTDHVGAAGDFSRAIEASAAVEPEYYLERAAALRAAEPPQLEEALRGLDQGMVRLGPLVTLTLAALEIEVERRDYDAALRRIDRTLLAVKRREQWLYRRAEILEKAGRKAEARASCDEASEAIKALPPRLRFLPATATLEQEINRLRLKLHASPRTNEP